MSACLVINGFARGAAEAAGAAASLLEGLGCAARPLHVVQLLPPETEPLGIAADGITVLRADSYETETFLDAVNSLYKNDTVWIFDRSRASAELGARLAARRKGTFARSVTAITAGQTWTVSRPCYSMHLTGTYEVRRFPLFATADPACTGQYKETDTFCGQEIPLDVPEPVSLAPDESGKTLAEAKRLLVIGLGAGNRAGAEEACRLFEETGYECGASRAAVMNGWMPMETLLGVSGSSASPEICIAAGVSGAPALYAGIAGSRHILAVNSDRNAPICRKADAVIEGDALRVLRLLSDQLKEERKA